MKDNTRIVVNSVVIYLRLIIVSVITFISVRYLLSNLGEVDFGLYNLIGGIVALFSFLSASMSQSTQRFLSLSIGRSDTLELRKCLKAAIYLHFIIAIIVSCIIQLGGLILIDNFLDIPSNKYEDAIFVLCTVTIGTFFTIIRVPYDAVLMAYENMLFVSLVQTGYAVFRFIGIIFLYLFTNKLHTYAILMVFLSILYYIINVIYTRIKYHTIKSYGTWQEIRKEIKSMAKFTRVYIIGAFATTFRDQGLPIVLNSVYGVIINASTAIATQINGVVSLFSSTIGTAIRPQLIKSAGAMNYARLSALSYASCKYPTLCVILIGTPIIVSMEYLQHIWLTNIPTYAVQFSQIILFGAFIQQLSLGLTGGIDASGKIKILYYSTAFFKIICIPLIWIIIKSGEEAIWAYILFVLSEVMCAYIRYDQAAKNNLISKRIYIKNIIIPSVLIFIILMCCDSIIWYVLPKNILLFILFIFMNLTIFILLLFTIGFTKVEKTLVLNRINNIFK